MSDHTLNPVNPTPNLDALPLPERIATLYKFPLAYHDLYDGKRYYAIQDWIVGVANPAQPRMFWAAMKRRFIKAQLEIAEQCRKLPYRTTSNKIYQLEYAPAEILSLLLNQMSLKTGIVSEIRTGLPYKQETKVVGYVYLITAKEISEKFKIGCTTDIKHRIASMRTVVPVTFEVLHLIESSDMKQEESRLHKMFHEKRLVGEWFALSSEDIHYIQSI